jgi:3-hydroxyacyl-CoA dehydrogenase
MLAEGGFFASNTSTLPISGLAQAGQPEKFVGIHFFSPVDKMKLVEIIRGKQTDDETVARAFDYVLALGKLPIVVNDSRGFYTSRTFGTYVMEGAAMLGEGIPAAVIENAAVQAGMPVGPLAVLDETALSLSVHVLDQTRADFAAEGKTYDATPGELLVERMVKELKRNGRAAGGGFYDYPQRREEAPVARAESAVRKARHHMERAGHPGPPALPPVGRNRALPGRRRADQRARRQHRQHLRHRLSGLDRRGHAVHLRSGHRQV